MLHVRDTVQVLFYSYFLCPRTNLGLETDAIWVQTQLMLLASQQDLLEPFWFLQDEED